MQARKLKIAVVSAFYSEGMGYTENCLSKALASLGHEIHLVTSTFNVYGNEPLDDQTYRGFPGPRHVASLAVEKCYAVTPDCGEVAVRFYGVPRSKIKLLSLGTDTDVFHPAESEQDRVSRSALRHSLGFGDDDLVCIYTGRFSDEKNP